MFKYLLLELILSFSFFFLFPSQNAFASAANNQFGIHILEPTDLPEAAKLVNSGGGDWGYVTIVLRETDMDQGKWQNFFNDCRQKHVIPIVRIATKPVEGGIWQKPQLDDLEKWPRFLNSLNWPVKKQIVIIFNEPNHAQEWGGSVSPGEYALVLDKLIQLFKDANANFFVLPAGLDQAAGNTQSTMDEKLFLQKIKEVVPDIFDRLDGWDSHSYPNHGFVGRPQDIGRATIVGYQWELNFLTSLGLTKELPIFITETGWPHQEGDLLRPQFYSEDQVATFFREAFAIWLNDARVNAVTPFIFNYPQPPFDHFSWLNRHGQPYSQYQQVLGLAKIKAAPEQVQAYQITKVNLPDILPTDYRFAGQITIKNTGQWIIGERESFTPEIKQSSPEITLDRLQIPQGQLLFPDQEITLNFEIKTGTQSAQHCLNLGNQEYAIAVFKPWSLKNSPISLWQQIVVKIKLWWLSLQNQ